MSKLEPGTPAPDFTAQDQEGKTFKLSDYRGKKVALYFYPKDDTPGCTAESCNLRDNYSKLRSEGYEVIGVSPDSVASHQKFAGKYNLPFRLAADTDKQILNAYGAYGEKNLYGKKSMGVLRTTYIIDEEGKIEKVIGKVDTKNHAEQILKK